MEGACICADRGSCSCLLFLFPSCFVVHKPFYFLCDAERAKTTVSILQLEKLRLMFVTCPKSHWSSRAEATQHPGLLPPIPTLWVSRASASPKAPCPLQESLRF